MKTNAIAVINRLVFKGWTAKGFSNDNRTWGSVMLTKGDCNAFVYDDEVTLTRTVWQSDEGRYKTVYKYISYGD